MTRSEELVPIIKRLTLDIFNDVDILNKHCLSSDDRSCEYIIEKLQDLKEYYKEREQLNN